MKKGISMIVLVITIIVMIILASSVVITLTNTGVLGKADEAVDLTDKKQVEHIAALAWSEAYIDNVRGAYLHGAVEEKLKENGVDIEKYNITVSNSGINIKEKVEPETKTSVTTTTELMDILTAESDEEIAIVLNEDIVLTAEEKLEINADVTLDLNGHTLTNTVTAGAVLVNMGTLTLKNGSIANTVSDTKNSTTIENRGTLIIESGTYGTDNTSGAAVINYGNVVIKGGTFASKQEDSKGDGKASYVFINHAGNMIIDNATINCETHGLFATYEGEIWVRGGNYTLEGNNGLGCYVGYASGTGKIIFTEAIINTNTPRSNRVFYVYKSGKNYFNADAVNTGNIVVDGATIYLNGVEQSYN